MINKLKILKIWIFLLAIWLILSGFYLIDSYFEMFLLILFYLTTLFIRKIWDDIKELEEEIIN